MRENQVNDKSTPREKNEEVNPEKAKQQQTDPQKTELKGFFDPKEDLEPTLEDGKKAPEKGPEGAERGS